MPTAAFLERDLDHFQQANEKFVNIFLNEKPTLGHEFLLE